MSQHAVARFAAHTRRSTLSRFTNRQISVCPLEEIATMAYLHVVGLARRCKEEFMPTVAVVSVLFAVLLLGVEAACAAPWCAQYGGGGGGTNCGFYSFQQCMAAVREMVGSAPRTNSKIPIGVVGRGPVRGEVRFGVIALTPSGSVWPAK